jgi:hypothetical protein
VTPIRRVKHWRWASPWTIEVHAGPEPVSPGLPGKSHDLDLGSAHRQCNVEAAHVGVLGSLGHEDAFDADGAAAGGQVGSAELGDQAVVSAAGGNRAGIAGGGRSAGLIRLVFVATPSIRDNETCWPSASTQCARK